MDYEDNFLELLRMTKLRFHKCVIDLKRLHNSSMLLLLETKLSKIDAKDQVAYLGFSKYYVVDLGELAGGLGLL